MPPGLRASPRPRRQALRGRPRAGRAATALADDLDAPERRATLLAGLTALRDDVAGLRGARESLALLLADPDLAWKVYGTAVLADALAEE